MRLCLRAAVTELTRRITSSKAAKTDAPFANGANIASLISWMGVPNVVIVLGNLLTRPSTCAAAFCRFAYIAKGFRTWTQQRRCFSLSPLSPSRNPFVSIRVHSCPFVVPEFFRVFRVFRGSSPPLATAIRVHSWFFGFPCVSWFLPSPFHGHSWPPNLPGENSEGQGDGGGAGDGSTPMRG